MDCPTLSKVLLVEDDQKLARLIASFLSQHGFEVRQVHRGDAAFAAFLDFKPQVVVLDLMLPGQNGLQVCREIRRVANLPILILTAQEDDLDHILGLESGADDYVIKPIEPPVLLARLRALMRRHAPLPASPESLTFGKLNIDRRRREAGTRRPRHRTDHDGVRAALAAGQPGREILSRDEILNQIRGIGFDGLNRSVDVCISKLRNKLKDNPREPVRIKTVWGKGYLFNPLGWGSECCACSCASTCCWPWGSPPRSSWSTMSSTRSTTASSRTITATPFAARPIRWWKSWPRWTRPDASDSSNWRPHYGLELSLTDARQAKLTQESRPSSTRTCWWYARTSRNSSAASTRARSCSTSSCRRNPR